MGGTAEMEKKLNGNSIHGTMTRHLWFKAAVKGTTSPLQSINLTGVFFFFLICSLDSSPYIPVLLVPAPGGASLTGELESHKIDLINTTCSPGGSVAVNSPPRKSVCTPPALTVIEERVKRICRRSLGDTTLAVFRGHRTGSKQVMNQTDSAVQKK